MRVIILAAGQSRRFLEVGYTTPKPFLLISWRGRIEPMLSHVLRSIPVNFHDVQIAIPSGTLDRVPTIADQTIRHVSFIEIEKTTGPAHTALQIINRLKNTTDTLILDVDVINHTNDLWTLCCLNSCSVLVSKSNNPGYSYVTNLGSFFHIKEKERISPYAVRGAYFIPQGYMVEFTRCLEKVIGDVKEPFISHALEDMPLNKYAMEASYDPIEWGTPLDVKISGATIIKEESDARH